MANYVFKDHSDIVLSQMTANSAETMAAVGEALVESVQQKMLYAYYREPIDTGRLFDSIEAEARRVSSNTYETTVGSKVPYAGYVHEGTSRMRGRPYIRDGVFDAQEKVRAIMEGGLSKGFK